MNSDPDHQLSRLLRAARGGGTSEESPLPPPGFATRVLARRHRADASPGSSMLSPIYRRAMYAAWSVALVALLTGALELRNSLQFIYGMEELRFSSALLMTFTR